MRVDIWSDVVCPWCYVGKARFERALSDFTHRDEVEVLFRAFELDPDYPQGERETAVSMLTRKYGIPEAQARAAEVDHAVDVEGVADGTAGVVAEPLGLRQPRDARACASGRPYFRVSMDTAVSRSPSG